MSYCASDNDCYMIGGKCNPTTGICYLPFETLEPIIVAGKLKKKPYH